ncbi:nucleotide sugar dehydrogenase [Bernardetia litoralis DSM 6794]|uniref:Nucleotide sugar dehydrogenase n=1 Tax=Bernardetia litoralis (strain ATCC 23117 / DSM 6794 / NBRC 15988 / NCIMB 1366 / Fx l1 / Sio-4) TaxID=880071 RepID=I4AI63_BERLS|nr:nucleotide sugar dehydrogenase [Bernardetia litoralis]AFM03648.1 nucleotide sugar dehydrogenase [Bernardetia litoralis DSM 6794]
MTYKLAIIGLGYVGLPLAAEFGKKYFTIGFDINKNRIEELKKGYDRTLEVNKEELKASEHLSFTTSLEKLAEASIYIVTVPTPVDVYKKPDLKPILAASKTVGKVLKKGDIVVYESTVYPGCTEEDCVPILEKESGLKFNQDFFCGYSPERINPGDKEHTISKIKKVVSGSTPKIAQQLNELYGSIITAGTHLASSIKVAEASKVIENAQRDLNIAFVNELALIFEKMDIDTLEVLEAAGTKWNFLPFKPGLVGGHCIGVDPYYLTYKAESLGYHPEVILAGRRINDTMGVFVASKVIKLMIQQSTNVKNAKILVLGITFKENCPDIRNSRVIDVIREFQDFGANVEVYDPWADAAEVKHEYNLDLIKEPSQNYDAIVLAVSHKEFDSLDFENLKNEKTIIYDIKGKIDKSKVTARL